jgi:antitoxin component YwqK of YwqJK toxin-antitoxin module
MFSCGQTTDSPDKDDPNGCCDANESCCDSNETSELNLDDPKVLKSIIAKSVEIKVMEKEPHHSEKLIYVDDKISSYSGWAKLVKGGKVSELCEVKDDYRSGVRIRWHANGNKYDQQTYKEGKIHGFGKTWHLNGVKAGEGFYSEGVGKDQLYTQWNTAGQKISEEVFDKGKLISAVHWKPNGDKCPITNVEKGNGIAVWHNDDGTEMSRATYKDGEIVKD